MPLGCTTTSPRAGTRPASVEMRPPNGANFTLEVRTPDERVFRSPQPAGSTERLEITMPAGFSGPFLIGIILENGSPGGDYDLKLELR